MLASFSRCAFIMHACALSGTAACLRPSGNPAGQLILHSTWPAVRCSFKLYVYIIISYASANSTVTCVKNHQYHASVITIAPLLIFLEKYRTSPQPSGAVCVHSCGLLWLHGSLWPWSDFGVLLAVCPGHLGSNGHDLQMCGILRLLELRRVGYGGWLRGCQWLGELQWGRPGRLVEQKLWQVFLFCGQQAANPSLRTRTRLGEEWVRR